MAGNDLGREAEQVRDRGIPRGEQVVVDLARSTRAPAPRAEVVRRHEPHVAAVAASLGPGRVVEARHAVAGHTAQPEAVEVILAIYKAAETGKAIELPLAKDPPLKARSQGK